MPVLDSYLFFNGSCAVRMPRARTFWSEAFGMLTDRFGTPWMVGGGEAR